MNLKDIRAMKTLIKNTVDVLGAQLPKLDKAEAAILNGRQPSSRANKRLTKSTEMRADIYRIESGNYSKPAIAKKAKK